MATLSLKPSKHGGKSLRYTKDVKSHSSEFERCLELTGINCNAENANEEFKLVWDRFGVRTSESIQTYNLIQSFSNDEFNPDNPEDILKVNELGYALALKLYPDRQVIIATQADNKGRNLHNHIVVNNVNPIDGSRLSGERTRWINLSKQHDELLNEYGAHVIDRGKAFDKQSIAEMKLKEAGKYVWKTDLKTRIEECLQNDQIKSVEEFKDKMKEDFNVDVRERGNGNLSYYFEDVDGKQRKIRASKLGARYGKEGVEYAIAQNTRTVEPVKKPEFSRLKEFISPDRTPKQDDRISNVESPRVERFAEPAHRITVASTTKFNERKRMAQNSKRQSESHIQRNNSEEFTVEQLLNIARSVDKNIRESAIKQNHRTGNRSPERGLSQRSEIDEPQI